MKFTVSGTVPDAGLAVKEVVGGLLPAGAILNASVYVPLVATNAAFIDVEVN